MTRQQIIAEYERMNRALELKFMPRVKRALHSKTRAVMAALRRGGYDAARRYLHDDISNESLTSVVRSLYTQVGLKHANWSETRQRADLVRKQFGFNRAWTQMILEYLNRFLLEKITFEVSNTTRDALLRVLQQGVEKGWSVDEIVNQLKDWPYERFQAARIVRTEVNRAANVGNRTQARTSEYQQVKEWISASDYRVRGHRRQDHANHVALNGTKINEDDVFIDSVNGDRLDFPGDPKASAASTINCRCVAAFTIKRDEQGNPIPKRRTTTVIFPSQTPRRRVVTV
jgi:hypothetical protein